MTGLLDLGYLLTAAAFILGIKRLGAPATARSGNQIAAGGMLVALAATLALTRPANLALIGAMLAVGAVAGAVAALRVRLTAMPQMVALFNGMGGGAVALIAAGELHRGVPTGPGAAASLLTIVVSGLLGAVSFSGSLLAFAKLQELLPGRPITFAGQRALNAALLAAALLLGGWLMVAPSQATLALFLAAALLFGVLLVLPIGGADMPVVIAVLNACTGLAAAVSGFLLGNDAMVVAGALVGASGTMLTLAMSRAMNRSLANVLLGGFGAPVKTATAAGEGGSVRVTTAVDVAVLLGYSREVIVVPGYGLATARAQHELKELADLLMARGVHVTYAIHPVAGRMPGHMNVLLAEAAVPYDQLATMEAVNGEFAHADVALVVGANDITNPAARADRASPIYGMPILNVDQAQTVVVLKRGAGRGFAGVDNALYTDPKTRMLFGDARASLLQLIAAVKHL